MPTDSSTPSNHEERTKVLQEDRLRETFPGYNGQIVATETVSAEPAKRVSAEQVLQPDLADPLPFDPYTHQAEALESLAAGENVTITTSTSSGKTLVYALQAARNIISNPESTAILVYPTKALTNNQQDALEELYEDLGLDDAIDVLKYDGDTEQDVKQYARKEANLILTNFAGLNVYLEQHQLWNRIFSNCDLVVIDEAHSYTGLQGMHVGWIVRRLRRLLQYYNSQPQFVCSSATIGNPQEHTAQLIGEQTTVIDTDGSPSGRRDLVFWNPLRAASDDRENPVDPEDLNTAQGEAVELMTHLGLHDVQTLAFTRSRQETEISTKRMPDAIRSHPRRGYLDIDAYHAGLGKETRFSIENRLQSGNVDGVFSTNALELGVDIGSVDATLLTGYPGSRQSYWQQVGRSGRGTSDALSVLIAREEGMDQYVVENPSYVLDDDVEDAVVDLSNDAVYADHVLCAANELPLDESDKRWFGDDRLEDAVEMWRRAGEVTGDLSTGVTYDGAYRPQGQVSLYKSSNIEFEVRCEDSEIDHEPVARERAYRDYHEGALVLHNGSQYEVLELNEDTHRPYVRVTPVSTNNYTQSMGDRVIYDLEEDTAKELANGYTLHKGRGTVQTTYIEYHVRDISTGELIDQGPIELPPLEMRTQMFWVTLPKETQTKYVSRWLDKAGTADQTSPGDADNAYLGGLHAAEHALIKMAPLELRLSKDDLGGMSTAEHPETGAPTIFVYDGIEGGLGFSWSIADTLHEIAERTYNRVSNCSCTETGGCPACVMSSSCGDGNTPLHTPIATMVLDVLTTEP